MIAVVIGVLAVLVVAAIIWARVGAARSENRSVETYEHALGVLGEVSKRTESRGFRILPHEETGRPHVGRRTDPVTGEVSELHGETGRLEQGPAAPRRLPPAGEPKLRLSGPSRPAGRAVPPTGQPAGDEGEQLETPPVPAAAPVAAQGQFRPIQRGVTGAADARARVAAYQSAANRRRQVMARRTATGATAAVALAAVVVAGVYLAGSGGGGGGRKGKSPTTTTRARGGGGTGRGTSTTTPTTTTTSSSLPTTLKPTSLSPVTFRVPSSDYTLAFQVTGGPCWVGIEHTGAGPWLFAETLRAGQSASYKATGSLIVTLGAPSHFALTVDGLAAQLPTATQAYSFNLTSTAG